MKADKKKELSNILNGYFGYQSFQTAIDEMASAGINNSSLHERYVSVITIGILAADQGEEWVIPVVRHSFASLPENNEQAKLFLMEVLSAYKNRYAQYLELKRLIGDKF